LVGMCVILCYATITTKKAGGLPLISSVSVSV
jgi:hypothetical protein